MRRLPVFLLVDVSYSMAGNSYEQLEAAIKSVVSTLRKDPYALETAYLSVIAFAGRPKTISPLVELISFRPGELPMGSGTSLGAAMNHLMDEIDRHVVKTTPDQKGDWRPIVFLLTDGRPTDDPTAAVARWNRDYRNRASLVAVSIGGKADHAVLRSLTDDVVVFNDAAPDAFARFAQWVSMSIQTQSRSVNAGTDGQVSLAKADSELFAHPEAVSGSPAGDEGERFAILVGRCEKSKLPYVVRYERAPSESESRWRPGGGNGKFVLDVAVPMAEGFQELSDNGSGAPVVDATQLSEWPSCPRCGAAYGMSYCACGAIHCVDGPGRHSCPWCGQTAIYDFREVNNLGGGRG